MTYAPLLALPLASLLGVSGPLQEGAVGFRGFEIYGLSSGTFGLTSGDLDGDGRCDLALIDNARARIEVFLRLPEDTEGLADEPDHLNDVVYDGRFRRLHHPVERRLWRIAALDLDGDGRLELAYTTDGGRLGAVEVAASGSPGAEPRLAHLATREIDALAKGTRQLSAVDLDGDGVDELLAAGEEDLVHVAFREGAWAAPRLLDRVEDGVDEITATDVDRDGRLDLVAFHDGTPQPLRVRLQGADGAFGPRQDLELAPLRSAVLGDVTGDGHAELVGVFQVSGRVAGFAFETTDAPQLSRYSLGASDLRAREARTFGLGDLEGDGAADLVVARADTSRLTVFLGRRDRPPVRLEASSLVGVADPRIGRVDDGAPCLVVVSGPERMVGFTRLADGELPFPETRAAEGEPAAADLADMDGDGYDDAVVVATTGEGRRREYTLQVWHGSPTGPAEAPEVHALGDLPRVPEALRLADLDRDGRPDAALFLGTSEVPRIYFQTDAGFAADERGEDAPGLGILEGAGRGRLVPADTDGDGAREVLVAAENFARALVLHPTGERRYHPQVLDQWDGPTPDAAVRAAAAGDLDGDGSPELVLWDEVSRDFVVLRGPGASAERVARVGSGSLTPLELVAADVDGDGSQEVVAFGGAEIAVLDLAGGGLSLRELGSVEAEDDDEVYDRLALADLDLLPGPEIVATELRDHGLTVFRPAPDGWQRLLGFRVFEEKSFSGGTNTREPRELTTGDFDADGRIDLALLVHDKLILYPQD